MLPVLRRRGLAPNVHNDEFDRLFNWAFGAAPSLSGWSPAVDVSETADGFVVTAELPGLAPGDVEVSVDDGVLSIAGEKKEESEDTAEGRPVVERRYGRFQRNFSLPRSVDPDKVEAKFEHGVLRVGLPKADKAKARKIKVA